MADNSSLYGSTAPAGTVSSSNYTTLYSGGNNYVPSGDNVIISGTLTVNGCAILTDCSSFNLLPFNATTVNAFSSATAVSIGGATGVTTIQNQLATGNYLFPLADGANTQVLATDGNGILYWANNNDFNTTYTIDAATTSGGANLNLVGSDSTTDSVKFASGTNVTVSRTDANTITINSSYVDTTYTQNASVTTGGANLNLVGSDATTDTIKFAGGTNVTVVATDANTITINAPDTNTTYTQNASATTGGANLNLVGSDSTIDPVKFASGTGITVTRTDADTITITNTDPGSAGVTSITGTANQIIASASTGAVTLSTPQDIATTSGPTFASVTAGNIRVGGTTDNTIDTITGDLLLDSASGFVEINSIVNIQADYLNLNSDNSAFDSAMRFNTGAQILYNYANSRFDISKGISVDSGVLFVDATNNRVGINNTSPLYELHIDQGLDGLTQLAMTTGERTALLTMNDSDDLLSLSYGPTFADNRLQFSPTAQWFNSGNLGVATATPAYTLDVNGTGNFQGVITGGLKINGSTNGFSNFIAPPTGSDLYYSLPGTAGAANTVLTNDGVGNLSWALPGGGGSTFGNITIAVATDNTISTTTGDLVLSSATGIMDASTLNANFAAVALDNRGTLDSQGITTTSISPVAINTTTRFGMKAVISVVDNVTTQRHILEALLFRQGTTAYITTYAEMYSNVALATFSADVSGGALRLLATPASTNSTTFTVIRTSID